jgi:hypothetical protein
VADKNLEQARQLNKQSGQGQMTNAMNNTTGYKAIKP